MTLDDLGWPNNPQVQMKIQVLVFRRFMKIVFECFCKSWKMDYGHWPCSNSLTLDDLILNLFLHGSLPRNRNLQIFSPKRVISRRFLDIFDHSPGQSDHNHLKNVQFVSHMSIGRKQTRQKTHFFRKISRNLEIFDRIKTTKYFSPDIIGLKFLGISHFLFSRVYLRWFNKLSKLVMREQTRIEMF